MSRAVLQARHFHLTTGTSKFEKVDGSLVYFPRELRMLHKLHMLSPIVRTLAIRVERLSGAHPIRLDVIN
jgi:hypothetical protein